MAFLPIGSCLENLLTVTAIITQNRAAYDEGLASFRDPHKKYWVSGGTEDREVLRGFLILEGT